MLECETYSFHVLLYQLICFLILFSLILRERCCMNAIHNRYAFICLRQKKKFDYILATDGCFDYILTANSKMKAEL